MSNGTPLINPSDILLVSDQQPLTLAFVNGVFTQFITAINNVGVRMDGYDAAEQNLVNLGLANINATLGPFLSTLQQAAQLGFLVAEADGQQLALTVGSPFECVMTSNGASLFTPTQWLMAIDVTDSTNWGILQLNSWVQADLNLSTNCIYATKTQQSSSWQVTCGSGVLQAMINDLNAATAAATNAQNSATSAANNAATVQSAMGAIQQGAVVSVNGYGGVVNLQYTDIIGLVAQLNAKVGTSTYNAGIAGLQPHSSTLDSLSSLALSAFIVAFLGATNATAAMSTLGAAPLASPAFSGTPTAPTPTAGDNSTKLATTAFLAGAGYQTTAGLAAAVGGLSINSSQIAAVFNAQTGTTYTFAAADYGKQVTLTAANPITATLPNSLPQGWNCLVWQGGAGQVLFSPASGATLRNRQGQTHTAGQYAMVSLMVMTNTSGTNAVYALGGDTA